MINKRAARVAACVAGGVVALGVAILGTGALLNWASTHLSPSGFSMFLFGVIVVLVFVFVYLNEASGGGDDS